MGKFYSKYDNRKWIDRGNEEDLDSYFFGWYGDNFYSNKKNNSESINANKSVTSNIPDVYKDDEIRNLKTELGAIKEDLADAKSELKYTKKKLYDYKTKADAFDKLFELFNDKFSRDVNYRDVTDHRGNILMRYKENEIYSLKPLTSNEVFKIIKVFFDAFGYDESEYENHWETTNVETDKDDSWGGMYHFYRKDGDTYFYHKKENKYK